MSRSRARTAHVSPARRWIGACLVAGIGLNGCASMIAHEHGLAKRIEVEKQAGPAVPRLLVDRTGPGRVEIAVLNRRPLQLKRRIVYNAIEIRAEWNPNPLWELFKIPFGVAAQAMAPFMYAFGMGKFEDTTTMHADTVRNSLGFWLGFLDPAQSVVAPLYVRDPNVDIEVFFSPVAQTAYAVSLPVAHAEVRFAVRDPSGVMLQQGVTQTDDFWLGGGRWPAQHAAAGRGLARSRARGRIGAGTRQVSDRPCALARPLHDCTVIDE